jgi:hypothetical protein
MKTLLLSIAIAASTLASSATAQSIAGEWDATMNTPGGARTFKILFQVDGDKLTGTVKRQAGDVPLTGTIKDSLVTFSYTVDYNGNALTVTMTAKVTGDSMKGTVDFAGAGQDEFSAKRARRPDGSDPARGGPT